MNLHGLMIHTVDGSEIRIHNRHPGCIYKSRGNNGRFQLPTSTGERRISEASTVSLNVSFRRPLFDFIWTWKIWKLGSKSYVALGWSSHLQKRESFIMANYIKPYYWVDEFIPYG